MPKNRDVLRSSAEFDEHLKAEEKRRAKLHKDRLRDEVRQLLEVVRDDLELEGRHVPDWQVKQHARKIKIDGQRQAADD
jgi:molecular chaperone GrpE (heat shock protein)